MGDQARQALGWCTRRAARSGIPYTIKDVQVTCMNKLYTGIGFPNDSGGMEFFSDSCRLRDPSRHEDDLVSLHGQLESMERELGRLSEDQILNAGHITEWQEALSRKEEESRQAADDLDHFVAQAKQGEIDEKEKARVLGLLKNELRVVTKERDKIARKVNAYFEGKSRSWFLAMCIMEMKQKIKEKDLSLSSFSTFTAGQPGLLTFPLVKGVKCKSCCLFADVLDYLAYICLSGKTRKDDIPRNCDSIVLNDPRNFLKMLISCDIYDHIYCFFPDTVTGKTMEKTILRRFDPRAVSMSYLYESQVTLYEYSMRKYDFSPLSLLT